MAANALADFTIGLSVSQRDMARAIQKQEAGLKKVYNSALAYAVEAGFSRRKLRGLETTMVAASKKMAVTQREIMALGEKLKKDGLTAELRERHSASLTELKEKRKQLKEEAGIHRANAEAAAKAYNKELAKEATRAKRRKIGVDKLKSGFGGGKGFGEGLTDLLSSMKGGDVKGVMSTAGKGAKGAGKLAKKGLSKAPGGGKMLKMMGKMGGFFAKLGTALSAIGAVAAVFIALVKLILDADAQMKEFRKTILKSNVSALDLGASLYTVGDAVDDVVYAFSGNMASFNFQRDWGLLAKEALQVVDAYAAAGVKVSEFTQGLRTAEQRQDKLRKSTEAALTYANLLGMQASEVAQKMGEMMGNMAQSLSGVRMQFSGLTKIAAESAYSTKKFFSQVLQATSGMSMYNVRLEETGVLLSNLQKALGAKDGFDLLQKIMGVISGKSMKDRMKDTEVSSGGLTARERDARSAMAERGKDFMATAGPEFMALFRGAAKDLNLKIDTSSGMALVKSMGRLGEKDKTKLVGAVGNFAKHSAEMKKLIPAMQHLFRFDEIGKGDKLQRHAALARAEPDFGPIYAMQKLEGILKRAAELGKGHAGVSSLIAEQLGVNLSTANQMQDLKRSQEGALVELKRIAAKSKEGAISQKLQLEQQKEWGVYLDWSKSQGKYIIRGGEVGAGGDEVKTRKDMFYANKEKFTEMMASGKESEDTRLAKEIAGATTEATKILSQMSEGVLTNIFKYVGMIYGFMFKSDAQIGNEAYKGARADLSMARKQSEKEFTRIVGLLAKSKETLGMTGDAGEKQKLGDQITNLEKEKARITKELAMIDSSRIELDRIVSQDPKMLEKLVETTDYDWELDSEEEQNARTRRLLMGKVNKSLGHDGLRYKRRGGKEEDIKLLAHGNRTTGRHLRVAQDSETTLDTIERRLRENHAEAMRLQREAAKSTQLATAMGAVAPPNLNSPMLLEGIAGELVSGKVTKGTLKSLKENPDFARKILGLPGLPKSAAAIIHRALKAPAANDMAFGVSNSKITFAKRIDTADQAIALQRPTGAMAKASKGQRGGTTVVTNNFWEGKGAFGSLRAYEKAKGAMGA